MVELVISSDREVPDDIKKEVVRKILFTWGQLIVIEIQRVIKEIPLWKTGDFWKGIHSWVDDNNVLHIEDTVFYGKYLEYGTSGHMVRPKPGKSLGWRSDGKYSPPGKKDKDRFSKGHFVSGIKAYAPFRRVLYNDSIMESLFVKAVQSNVPSSV